MIYFRRLFLLCFVLAAIACNAANYDPVALYLTWQRNPESTMIIRWLTPPDRQEDLIEYQQENVGEWLTANGYHMPLPQNVPYLMHSVELTHLQPDTNYIFRTGHDGRIFKFQTMPATLNQPIRFVAGGDMYHDGIEFLHATNRQAASTSPLFALVGGDIAYAADSKASYLPSWLNRWIDTPTKQDFNRWLAWLIAWKNDMVTPDGRLVPFLPVVGNHDVNGEFEQTPVQAPFFYSLFAMPGQQGYNVLDFSNYMSIILLDSDHSHPIKGDQTNWLANTLKCRQHVPHKFALYHVPAYPSARSYNLKTSQKIRKYWVPYFDRYQLTAAFENHDHTYKRTHPMLNGAISQKGVIYIGDGAWGVESPRTPSKPSKKLYLAQAASKRHFLLVTIEPEKRTVTAVSSDGETFDQLSW